MQRWRLGTFCILLVFLVGCGDDDNPAESGEFGSLSGTVEFVGTWPDKGNVEVAVWPNWPPAGPPTAYGEPFSSGEAVQTYRIEGLSKGTYAAVSVSWRDPIDPAGAKVLGFYWEEGDSPGVDERGRPVEQPLPIEISDGKLEWSEVDIKANLDIAP